VFKNLFVGLKSIVFEFLTRVMVFSPIDAYASLILPETGEWLLKEHHRYYNS
jgi:hypothetical protein